MRQLLKLTFLSSFYLLKENQSTQDIHHESDEKFKEHFTLFDTHNNLNFAMGYDYRNGRIYKSLEALYGYWQRCDKESRKLLERYGFDLDEVEKKVENLRLSSCRLIYKLLNRGYDLLTSDQALLRTIEFSELEFDIDGNIVESEL